MGRTGRRDGQAANTTLFCEDVDTVLQAIALIELARDGWVEEVAVNWRCWPVLIHQLLAMSLASNGIPVEEAWSHLSAVPDFREITRDEFDQLIKWMLQDESLVLVGGRLVLGSKVERQFGRRNFMELYAVFSSPQSYTVETANKQVIGTLNQDFVDGLVDGVSCFLLHPSLRDQHADGPKNNFAGLLHHTAAPPNPDGIGLEVDFRLTRRDGPEMPAQPLRSVLILRR